MHEEGKFNKINQENQGVENNQQSSVERKKNIYRKSKVRHTKIKIQNVTRKM